MPASSFPTGSIQLIKGRALVVQGEDIDTDRIIPARFLKCVSFEALGDQVFADDRLELNGAHPFDQAAFQGASILVVNGNFGCGSSREHAPQALMRWGIRAVVGVSFAEIFYGNCLALGIPCVTASPEDVQRLQQTVIAAPEGPWTLDLEALTLSSAQDTQPVALAEGPRQMLTTGRWDATSQLISRDAELSALRDRLPYLNGFRASA
ncbi:3-isopropylmalate dehydratase small subunit [Parasynechococcus sp.]|jgi:3-isopropylmalate/(R)-2-methylmalate dehydratase small subunit|uniref:3-isopropylmalate dehydratase small subunit n=1 Tax=Parasynechococcus sp. TaxID=3101203 RepID=UPI00370441B5